MKKTFFIGLLISLNILVISCLPETSQEKCNKFLDEFHNPIAKKSKERDSKCNDVVRFMNILTDAELESGDIDHIYFKERIITKLHSEKNDLRTKINQLERNNCQKLSKEEFDLIKKAQDSDDSVCKNVTIHTAELDTKKGKKPGEDGYKKFLQDSADYVQKIDEFYSKFISKTNVALSSLGL